MKKFFSLLRAVMSQDMRIFVFKAKRNSSTLTKILIPVILAILVMFSMGGIYLPLAVEFHEKGVTHIILEISIAFPGILAFIEGVYKSQGILFEAKDNELLFSLPISKKQILLSRLIKLYAFQFLYSLLFIIPGIVCYLMFEKAGVYFYLITGLTLLLFPIIPTVLGCFFGYIVKKFSVNFKSKKLVQTIFTIVIVSALMILSLRMQDLVKGIVDNSNSIDSVLTKYYPIGAYLKLLSRFDIVTFILLLFINAVVLSAFVLIVSKSYFKIVSKSKENIKPVRDNSSKKEYVFKQNNSLFALLKKELARYFSSTVYMFNTLFGLALLIIATVSLCMNFDGTIDTIASEETSEMAVIALSSIAPKVYLAILVAMSFMTSITSSSISLEGKSFNISKSLPVKVEKQLLAKVLMSDLITIPVILICDVVFCVFFEVGIIDIVSILFASFLAPSIAAVFGLIINLKFPKMDASSDTEVVKQSMSSMISVFGGMLFAAIFLVITFLLAAIGDFAILIEVILLAILLTILWIILGKYGKKRYREIEA